MTTFHLESLESISIDTPWGVIVLVAMPDEDGCLIGLQVPEGLRSIRHRGREEKYDLSAN